MHISLGAGEPWQKGTLCDRRPVLSGFQFYVSQILIDLQPHGRSSTSFLHYIRLDGPRAHGLWSSLEPRLGVSESIPQTNCMHETERTEDSNSKSSLLLRIFPSKPRGDRCRVNPVAPTARCNVHVLSNWD